MIIIKGLKNRRGPLALHFTGSLNIVVVVINVIVVVVVVGAVVIVIVVVVVVVAVSLRCAHITCPRTGTVERFDFKGFPAISRIFLIEMKLDLRRKEEGGRGVEGKHNEKLMNLG